MPFIDIKTNKKVSDSTFKSIREKLDELIPTFPGKSKTWLMTSLTDDCRIGFSGTDEPCAMVEVKLFGNPSRDDCENFAKLVTPVISEELGILKPRIYVKFEGCELWSFFGQMF